MAPVVRLRRVTREWYGLIDKTPVIVILNCKTVVWEGRYFTSEIYTLPWPQCHFHGIKKRIEKYHEKNTICTFVPNNTSISLHWYQFYCLWRLLWNTVLLQCICTLNLAVNTLLKISIAWTTQSHSQSYACFSHTLQKKPSISWRLHHQVDFNPGL
jgi:hypothetical protein